MTTKSVDEKLNKDERETVDLARRILATSSISNAAQQRILEAGIILHKYGKRIFDDPIDDVYKYCHNVWGKDFYLDVMRHPQFDDPIGEREAKIEALTVAYEEARERTQAAADDIGGAVHLLDSKIMVATGKPRRELTYEQERRLQDYARACALDEQRTLEDLEREAPRLREEIRVLMRARSQWISEQAEK